MLHNSVDPYGKLLAYRTTSLECGYSQAELLTGRQLCAASTPVLTSTSLAGIEAAVGTTTERQLTEAYDRRQGSRPPASLDIGDPDRMQDARTQCTLTCQAGSIVARTWFRHRHLVFVQIDDILCTTPNEQAVHAESATVITLNTNNDETRPRSTSSERQHVWLLILARLHLARAFL